MKVTDVRAVIAIGLRGQFGLHGRLPWEGTRRAYVADVERSSSSRAATWSSWATAPATRAG